MTIDERRVVCFGELLIRLAAPGRELLLQSPRLGARVGGAEANVAVALAKLGHCASFVSIVPENDLGEAALSELRRHGVDCRHVLRTPGRMGLYFLTEGAGARPSQVLYDRTHSAFAQAGAEGIDWRRALEGAEWLHVTGITPALGLGSEAAALRAVREAHELGLKISFDANFRQQLWQARDADPRPIMAELIRRAHLFFGSLRDIELVLGRVFEANESGIRAGMEAAFLTFPNLQIIASTRRRIGEDGSHHLSARIDSPLQSWRTGEALIPMIVDRVGAGDAFAAGVLHGLLTDRGMQQAVEDGLKLSCLKHSLPGDAALFSREVLHRSSGLDIQR